MMKEATMKHWSLSHITRCAAHGGGRRNYIEGVACGMHFKILTRKLLPIVKLPYMQGHDTVGG
jgi:hypothetical protein